MHIHPLFDPATYTITYVLWNEGYQDALIIDPVLDYDPASGKIGSKSLNKLEAFLKEKSLLPVAALETHAHADHLSSSYHLKELYPEIKIGIGEHIMLVQKTFKDVFHLPNLAIDGSQFDYLFSHDQTYLLGSFKVKVLATPGHTPACVSYLIEDALFTGDALFMPDQGTGRCDFPKGSVSDLYESIQNIIYSLPDQTRIFVGHDYGPGGRDYAWETSVKESKEKNIQLSQQTTKEEFTKFRNERDAKLNAPKLLLQSIQVNINAGQLPEKESNGTRYLKIPIS